MANSVDPDETPRSAASHLGLYCMLRPPNTYGKYGSPRVGHWLESHSSQILLIIVRSSLVKFQQTAFQHIFLIFSQKVVFDLSSKLSLWREFACKVKANFLWRVYMKVYSLFSGKNIFFLIFFPECQS